MARERKKIEGGGIGDWVVTYGDMVTLLLCFFVAMFDTNEATSAQVSSISASLQSLGLGSQPGGNTLSEGKLADLGNTVSTMPSMEKGKSLASAKKKAIALFNPEIKSAKLRVTADERGLVISLAADAFFPPASAVINLEQTRGMLVKLAELLKSDELRDAKTGGTPRNFRIEGHTDSEPSDPNGAWPSNWELSAQRAINILHYLTDFGVDDRRFQVAGFADTRPLQKNDTPEGRAYNRRVDIIILDPGHL